MRQSRQSGGARCEVKELSTVGKFHSILPINKLLVNSLLLLACRPRRPPSRDLLGGRRRQRLIFFHDLVADYLEHLARHRANIVYGSRWGLRAVSRLEHLVPLAGDFNEHRPLNHITRFDARMGMASGAAAGRDFGNVGHRG
jgi:hypothetical protein